MSDFKKERPTPQTPQTPAGANVVSVLDVDADGATVKLWPAAYAVRQALETMGTYSTRHYVCGRALYCAVAFGDVTRDAPCPESYRVRKDANLNEADGSLIAAAAEWGVGTRVFALPPIRISKERVQINPVAGRDGKTIHHYVLADRLSVADIKLDDKGCIAEVQLRKASDGGVIAWQAN